MGYRSVTCFSNRTGAGLMTYSSEDEALRRANHSKSAYEADLTPYKCDRCASWHLSPTRRAPVKCDFCFARSGEAKTTYESEEDALEAADRLGWRLRPYMCPHYEGWHLTSRR